MSGGGGGQGGVHYVKFNPVDVRSEPVRSFSWGVDSVHNVKFNRVEVRFGQRNGQDLSAVLTVGWGWTVSTMSSSTL